MPGPKMGARPPDFNEEVIKQSPTFIKWTELKDGQQMRYACRVFVKGAGDDEERLMRRIMIARRNNIKDHEVLKSARKRARKPGDQQQRRRRPAATFSDQQVEKEMDVPAVEATRSYQSWKALKDGDEFVYNQKYIKGKEGHDWLLRKNIWRRMRYRRENKKMVEGLKGEPGGDATGLSSSSSSLDGMEENEGSNENVKAASEPPAKKIKAEPLDVRSADIAATDAAVAAAAAAAVDTPVGAAAAAAAADIHLADPAAVEAAVAAAESFEKNANVESFVADQMDTAALDAAAKLAAAQRMNGGDTGDNILFDM